MSAAEINHLNYIYMDIDFISLEKIMGTTKLSVLFTITANSPPPPHHLSPCLLAVSFILISPNKLKKIRDDSSLLMVCVSTFFLKEGGGL